MTLLAANFVLLTGLLTLVNDSQDPRYLDFLGVLIIGFIALTGFLMFWRILYNFFASLIEWKRKKFKSKSRVEPEKVFNPL